MWFEGDVEKALADLATNDSDFMSWFRGRVLDLTGVDLSAPQMPHLDNLAYRDIS